jgi:hypothetical protein
MDFATRALLTTFLEHTRELRLKCCGPNFRDNSGACPDCRMEDILIERADRHFEFEKTRKQKPNPLACVPDLLEHLRFLQLGCCFDPNLIVQKLCPDCTKRKAYIEGLETYVNDLQPTEEEKPNAQPK